MADSKISVSELKKTIYFCIIFSIFSPTMETRRHTKAIDLKQVDTSPQEKPVRHHESLLGAGMAQQPPKFVIGLFFKLI